MAAAVLPSVRALLDVIISPTISQSVQSLSRVRLFATLWTAAYQAPPSMGFSRQKYWMELGAIAYFDHILAVRY